MADGKVVIETGLDTAGIEKGISQISKLTATGLKTAAAAIGGVSTALMGAGGYAVKVGSDFESAMSKVEAISGATASQMEALTQKAKEMGASTKFSATESAEAFQYMAMAGWNSAQMIDGIGGIMNLAAADGLDLATTSDIVTDALTAFGLAAADSTHFADVLATASSSANTNVFMLGESFKYVAPVAGAMKYSVEDVSKALGLMANASVKGSMAGTSLKTALANLAAPTDKMQEAMDKYGISLTDSKGKMKSLDEVMLNLRESLGGLSEDEQTAAASTLFGKEAMAGMLAIVNASEKDYKKLSEAIANADGTAQEMADTMNDNLQGKMTLAKSALEGLGIQFYETVQDDMKNAVEEGTVYIDRLSQAFTNGGLEAAVNEAGDIVADLATKIAQSAPNMVEASTDLIQAFVKGIIKNRKQLKAASQDIVDAVCDGLIKLLPKKIQEPAKKALDSLERTFKSSTKNILNIGKSTLESLAKLFGKLADNMDTVLPVVGSPTAGFKSFQMVSGPVGTAVSVFQKMKNASSEAGLAMSALNAVMNANPAVLIAGGISLLAAALAAHVITAGRADEAQDAFNRRMDELGASIENTRNDLDSLSESMEDTYQSVEAQTAPLERLKGKLDEAFDSTGKVKEGNEELAESILNQLNEAMGTEYSLTAEGFIQDNEGVKQSLDDVNKSIDEYVQKLKQSAIAEATKSQYADAMQAKAAAQENLTKAQQEYNDAMEEFSDALAHANENGGLDRLKTAQENLKNTEGKLSEASKAAADADVQMSGLDAVMNKLGEGTPESVQEALDMYGKIPAEAQKAADGVYVSQATIQQVLGSTDYSTAVEGFKLAFAQIEESGGEIPASLRDSILKAIGEFQRMGPESQEQMRAFMGQMLEGMSEEIPEFEDLSIKTSEEIIETMNNYLVRSGAMRGTGKETMGEVSSGISEGTPEAIETASQGVISAADAASQTAQAEKEKVSAAGAELESGIPEGAAAVDTTTVPTQKSQEAVDSAVNAAMAGIPAVQQAAQAGAGAINTGYQSTDVTSGASQAGNASVQALIDSLVGMNGSVLQATASIGIVAATGLGSANMSGAFGKQGSEATSQFTGSITNSAGNVTSAVSTLGKAATNALKNVNLSNNFQIQAKNAVSQFCTGIRSQTSSAVNATKALGTSVNKALAACNLNASAQTQGRSFGSSFASGISGQSTAVAGAARTLGSSAQNALSGFGNTGHSIGVQFSSGLANGIRAGAGGVAAAAAAVANAAANAAKANLQIHSPSRVGGYIGRMFDKGIELDVEKGSTGIEKAVKNVTDIMKINPSELLQSMRGAFDSTISRITNNRAMKAVPVTGAQQDKNTGDIHQTINFYEKTNSPVEMSRAVRKEARRLAFIS